MKPIARVWYTKPPINNKFFGTRNDWNQGILTLINDFAKEACERNHYGNNLLEYISGENINEKFKKVIKSHSKSLIFFNYLDGYIDRFKTLYCIDNVFKVEYSDECHPNILKYIDGLYENEIILIDEPCKS